MFSEFDGLIEPSRNHRAYRIAVGKLQPPILPFMPLLLKGAFRFTHIPVTIMIKDRLVTVDRYDLHSRGQPDSTGQRGTDQFREDAHAGSNYADSSLLPKSATT